MKRLPCWCPNSKPLGVELFSRANAFFCSNKFAHMLATWEKTLYSPCSIYFKILTWLRGFLVIFLSLVWFSLCSSIARQRSLEKFEILTLKSRLRVMRKFISSVKCKLKKVVRGYASVRIAYRGHVHGSLNTMQSSLDMLKLGPRVAKNKPRWKEDKQRKSRQKRKLYNWAQLFKAGLR